MAKVALLIGVSEYPTGLKALPAAVQDVDAMRRVLQHPEMGGFAEADITVLKNPQRQVMEEAIEELFSFRRKDDLVLLYFSGHGITDDNGRLFLTTCQTQKNSKGELVKTTAVTASLLHGFMENSRSKKQVIILDCCFSGAFAKGLTAKNDGKLDIKNQLADTNKPEEIVEGRAILTSSTSTQYSFEQQDADLSIYTQYLVEGIEKGAADTDNDGEISVDELHDYARKKVQEVTYAMKPEIFAIREGYKIKLAKATYTGDSKLEYRKEVERCINDGKISRVARRLLTLRQTELELSIDVAEQIEKDVLESYWAYKINLDEYEEVLRETIEDEGTLSSHTREMLKRLQQSLKLRDKDIATIHAKAHILPTSHEQKESPVLLLGKSVETQRIAEPKIIEEYDFSLEEDIDYTKLRDLLAAGKWKEADRETYMIALRAARHAEGDSIKTAELVNFSCANLHTIDSLWLQFSNGRFGLSVQKQIYLNIGGKLDGKLDEETWGRFSDRVGWRVDYNKNWISYDNVIFDISAPKGHLPMVIRWFGWVGFGWGGSGFSALVSRLASCHL
ncbi:MAG: GUN4 domain-containing protein [Scytonema sp. PMC 1069.18]|nr:GUN4 domain-containing protein [Scytonema sp. PMC 1069.18]MEC4883292.1 GUN4 domain-containing protein [Scytonema sp. PMC 1070.18]